MTRTDFEGGLREQPFLTCALCFRDKLEAPLSGSSVREHPRPQLRPSPVGCALTQDVGRPGHESRLTGTHAGERGTFQHLVCSRPSQRHSSLGAALAAERNPQ